MSELPPAYTQIPNSLLDTMADLTEPELRVALAICRQTFGWHRDTASLSGSFLAKATGLSERACVLAGCKLTKKGMVEKSAGTENASNVFAFLMRQSEQRSDPSLNNDQIGTSILSEQRSDSKPQESEQRSEGGLNNDQTNKERSKERTLKKSDSGEREGAEPRLEQLPEVLRSEAFAAAWAEWIKFRKDTKHSLTVLTIKKQLKLLAYLGEQGAIASINQSIEAGWQGLFEARNENRNKVGGTGARRSVAEERNSFIQNGADVQRRLEQHDPRDFAGPPVDDPEVPPPKTDVG